MNICLVSLQFLVLLQPFPLFQMLNQTFFSNFSSWFAFCICEGQGMVDGKKALYHCNYCNKDISGKIRIKCVVCSDFDLCVECFSVGAEVHPHKSNHPYRVMVSYTLTNTKVQCYVYFLLLFFFFFGFCIMQNLRKLGNQKLQLIPIIFSFCYRV